MSILTLTHEAVHKRLHSNNEGYVACTAMKMMPDVTSRLLGVPSQLSDVEPVTVRYRATIKKRVHGKVVNVRVWRTRTDYQSVTIPNPKYDAIQAGAMKFHLGTPARYQGVTC